MEIICKRRTSLGGKVELLLRRRGAIEHAAREAREKSQGDERARLCTRPLHGPGGKRHSQQEQLLRKKHMTRGATVFKAIHARVSRSRDNVVECPRPRQTVPTRERRHRVRRMHGSHQGAEPGLVHRRRDALALDDPEYAVPNIVFNWYSAHVESEVENAFPLTVSYLILRRTCVCSTTTPTASVTRGYMDITVPWPDDGGEDDGGDKVMEETDEWRDDGVDGCRRHRRRDCGLNDNGNDNDDDDDSGNVHDDDGNRTDIIVTADTTTGRLLRSRSLLLLLRRRRRRRRGWFLVVRAAATRTFTVQLETPVPASGRSARLRNDSRRRCRHRRRERCVWPCDDDNRDNNAPTATTS